MISLVSARIIQSQTLDTYPLSTRRRLSEIPIFFSVLLVIATWKRKGWLLKTWLAITSICAFSDLRSVLFDLMVGSVDIGLAFAVISLVGNLGCLVIVFYFERHVAEEKARIFQQTWITTEETRKNAGYESDIDDMEDAEEVQV